MGCVSRHYSRGEHLGADVVGVPLVPVDHARSNILDRFHAGGPCQIVSQVRHQQVLTRYCPAQNVVQRGHVASRRIATGA